jgi:hypothetical protein
MFMWCAVAGFAIILAGAFLRLAGSKYQDVWVGTFVPSSDGPLSRAFARVFSFPVMLMAWIVVVVVRLAENNLPDVDLWWHLRNAQTLLTLHHLPTIDTYSFTVAGHPYMNYEWLAELPYYLAWRAFGLEGIEAVMLVLLEAIFLGVLYLCYQRSGHIKASILACWFAVFLGTVNFGPRTVLFGYACLVAMLIILERFRARGRAPLWALPLLFCLWINLHGSWALGMVIFALWIASGLVGGEWGHVVAERWTSKQLRQLLVAFGASCAALFANPYGYRLVLYPLDMALRQRLNIAFISEWQSIDLHSPRGKATLLILAGLFVAALASRYRWRLSDVALLLFAFYAGLTYERFLFLAGIVVAPMAAEMLHFVPSYRREIDKPWLNAAVLGVVAALVIYQFPGPATLEQQTGAQYPAEVIPYLQAHPLSGRALNFYSWGGYLEWKDPDLKVFIDSRVDIYEYAGVFKDYVNPVEVLDDYHIRYVLFPNQHQFIYLLRRNPDWKVLFSGPVATLLERVGPMPSGPAKDPASTPVAPAW